MGYRESCTKLEGISRISPKYAWSTNWKSFPRPMHSAHKMLWGYISIILKKNYFFLILKILKYILYSMVPLSFSPSFALYLKAFWSSAPTLMKLHFLFLSLILFIHYPCFSQFWLPILEILFPSDFPNTKPEILNLFICVVYLKKLSEIAFLEKKKKSGMWRTKSSQKVIQRKELETYNFTAFNPTFQNSGFLQWWVKELKQKAVYLAAETGNVLWSMKRRKLSFSHIPKDLTCF